MTHEDEVMPASHIARMLGVSRKHVNTVLDRFALQLRDEVGGDAIKAAEMMGMEVTDEEREFWAPSKGA